MEHLDELRDHRNYCIVEVKQEIDPDKKPIKIESCLDIDSSTSEFFDSCLIKNEELDLGEDVIILSDTDEGDCYLCEECGFRTWSESTFPRHRQHHDTKPKNFSCSQCPFKTIYVGDLHIHALNSHSVKTEIKEETGWKKSDLNRPEEVDNRLEEISEDNPNNLNIFWLKCGHCSFKTQWGRSLVKHYKERHSKSQVFQCHHCLFITNRRRDFSTHVVQKHPDLVRWHCGKCLFKTEDVKALREHDFREHGVERKPNVSIIGLNKCSSCSFQSTTRKELVKHMVKNHPLPLDCSVQRNHCQFDNIVWYKCGRCPFKSNTEDNVKLHLSKIHYTR